MIVLILLAFAGMMTGIFLILGMTPFTFAEELTKPLSGRRQPISKRIQQVNHPKEPKGIRKTVQEAREMLILTGKGGKFAAVCAFSLFLAAMGAVICIVIQNYFMLPVLTAGMGLLPFWYVLFTSHSYKKLMNNEIETGLSIITSSYLRSESMITAVEENIHYLNPPVADFLLGDILLLEDWKQANHLSDDLAMEFTTNESGDRIFAEGIVIPMTGIENYPYTILFNLSGDRPELCKERNRLQLRKSGYSLKVDHNMLMLFTWPILEQFTPEKVKDLISYYSYSPQSVIVFAKRGRNQ